MFLFICCPIVIIISIVCCVVCAVNKSTRQNKNVHVATTGPTTTAYTSAANVIPSGNPNVTAYPVQPSASAPPPPGPAAGDVYPPAPYPYPADPTFTSQAPPPYPGTEPYPTK